MKWVTISFQTDKPMVIAKDFDKALNNPSETIDYSDLAMFIHDIKPEIRLKSDIMKWSFITVVTLGIIFFLGFLVGIKRFSPCVQYVNGLDMEFINHAVQEGWLK